IQFRNWRISSRKDLRPSSFFRGQRTVEPADRYPDPRFIISLVFTSTLIVAICSTLDPVWESNDDVLMSMVAHGYGRAVHGSPNLIYSNVIWGYLIRAIPPVDGILGYSVATIAVLLTAGSGMLYFLLRLGAGYPISLLILGLVIAPSTLLPQFTVNAGLLTAVAALGWSVHAR